MEDPRVLRNAAGALLNLTHIGEEGEGGGGGGGTGSRRRGRYLRDM